MLNLTTAKYMIVYKQYIEGLRTSGQYNPRNVHSSLYYTNVGIQAAGDFL